MFERVTMYPLFLSSGESCFTRLSHLAAFFFHSTLHIKLGLTGLFDLILKIGFSVVSSKQRRTLVVEALHHFVRRRRPLEFCA